MPNDSNRPPRLTEQLLRILLKPRDRDTIAGDLLEEYREVVLPTRGRLRARLWYLRQVVTFVDGLNLGLLLGVAFGLWNLVGTWIDPLAEDTPMALLSHFGPMFVAWAVAAFSAARRSGRVLQGISVGVTVAVASFVVFYMANLVRVNLFLETIRFRTDWHGVLVRFPRSGFTNFRAFANWEWIKSFPVWIGLSLVIGAAMGLVGGLAGYVFRRNPDSSQLPSS